MHLANKVVILTGASQGIGKAAAAKFIEAGCRVVLVARSEDRLAQLAEMLG
ncbi:MAG: SDR family NAD(P)-dependent oxidoreductase, partial [Phycisphaerae bacterium]|nr:SDR family NAD(P)-dependent oxidoreductase [Phycisphaerae bacterium]NIX28237.1 SDR family NAD(P)-dependent oxidoreductase [Phycisphaerae bacterium]